MKYPIGILDYGIGGIDLAKKIKSRNPHTPILYFSDSGETPYGKLTYKQLRNRVRCVLDFMFEEEVGHIVVACHSASSVVLASDENVTPITESTVSSIIESKVKTVGIIGGGRTIRSQKYRKALRNSNIQVEQRVAQEFSILIEAGITEGPEIETAIQKILWPIRNQEAILLACTHYPAIVDKIQAYIGYEKTVIDPIEHIYNHILPKLKNDTNIADQFFTTGNTALMKNAAKAAFSFDIQQVKQVDF